MRKQLLSSCKITWRPAMSDELLEEPKQKPDEQPNPVVAEPIVQQPINGQPSGLVRPKRSVKKILLWVGLSVAAVVLAVATAVLVWYNTQLAALGSDKQHLIVVTIEQGATPVEIGELLQSKAVIRSSTAFDIYTRLVNKRNVLQAGTYRLSPAENTPEIVEHLVKGDVDEFSITFYPGGTLKQHRKVLIDAGYTATEVDEALSATYDSPLFESKPASADLEGYIFGQTYQFNAGASVSDILSRTFEEFYATLSDNNLIAGIKAQGYTLYQGITLASIVQKEVASPGSSEPSSDQKQVAQVFYSRLAAGMTLGSDVTYQYAADKLDVQRDVNLDSPYNTRRYEGLPPGPISSPGASALEAVAAPASGDYLFFLSGDDDITYFARTDAEHEANIRDHCQKKCLIL